MSLSNNTVPKIKVLLVEDGLLALLAEKMSLERMGCAVDVASTGQEAIELGMKNNYDLILMDLELGNIDGFAVTKEIRMQSSKNAKTPIVALTAYINESYKVRAQSSGMNDFLVKPLAEDQMQYIFNKYFAQAGKNKVS